MSRRGRLPPFHTSDNQNNTDHIHDLRIPSYEISSKPQLWQFKKKTPIHPALTNYGPESLQCFLRDELEKLKYSALEEQRKQIIDLARTLVDFPGNLHSVRDDTAQSLSTPLLARGPHDIDETSEKGKGKAPTRRRSSHTKLLTEPARPDHHIQKEKPSGARAGLQTIIHRATRSSSKFKLGTPPVITAVRDVTVAQPNQEWEPTIRGGLKPTFASQARQWANAPLHNVNPNHSPRRTTRRSLRLLGPQKSSTQHDAPRPPETLVEETFDTLDDLTLNSDAGSNDAGLTVNPHDFLALNPGRLTRAASFENHADHTRDFRRTRDKTFLLSNQPAEESRRRRKTPTHTHGRPSSSLPSAFEAQLPSDVGENRVAVFPAGEDVEEMDGTSINPTISPYGQPEASLQNLRATSLQSGELPTNLSTIVNHDHDLVMFDMNEETMARQQLFFLESEDELDDFEEQQVPFGPASQTLDASSPNANIVRRLIAYDYSEVVPEDIPHNFKQAEINRSFNWRAHSHDSRGKPNPRSTNVGPLTTRELDPRIENILNEPDDFGDYKRPYVPPLSPSTYGEPHFCPPSIHSRDSLPHEIWEAGVLEYLSSAEVRLLRLVCKIIAEDLEPYVFRSVVVNFGPSFFNINASSTNNIRPDATGPGSMLEKFGPGINKFGIAFEYDQLGMNDAPFKVTETNVDAWFGNYKWPVKEYPYFASLKEIDMLLDDQPRLLTQAMKNLHNCHELALSVDSGHGWLEGPDMSDLALYRHRAYGGSRVFGKTFSAEDSAYENGMKQLFEWAQRNTINENIKHIQRSGLWSQKRLELLRDILIRDYDSYRVQNNQPDFEKDLHTGKEYVAPGVPINNATGPFGPANQPPPPNPQGILFPINNATGGSSRRRRQRLSDVFRLASSRPPSLPTEDANPKPIRRSIQPQWPLVFNGYNVSADVGGDTTCVQERVSNPTDHPLMPGNLNEAQAQWIMETSWIQRTFLSSYTDAIRTNAAVFKKVHSLHISKLSSGLLPSLSQKTFWSSLPDLRKLTIFVKPDWRVEHIPGDKFHHTTMNIKLSETNAKFLGLLRDSVAKIETLNNLHIGYCSGGEHQKGIFGRNQHVLPAPIVQNPRNWLLAQNPALPKANEDTMISFPHVRNLTFENCWFSPLMLETFMQKSQDSSLHHLVLDSVSLTARVHSTRTDGPLRTYENQLKCMHPSGAWLQEHLPANASWVHVLDNITPGRTIQDQKYDTGMINEEEVPRPEAQFRGNTQMITLNSCGYVKIQNVSVTEFNQNELVFHSTEWNSLDEGLKLRASRFTKTLYSDASNSTTPDDLAGLSEIARPQPTFFSDRRRAVQDQDVKERQSVSTQFIMQGGHTAQDILFGLTTASGPHSTGALTQCIHPVEKRILEQNWGMKFGWGDDMRRWEAVEDGWFIGGTGRFSGKIYKDRKMQEQENNMRLQEAAKLAESTITTKDEVPEEAVTPTAPSARGSHNFFSGIFGGAGPSNIRQPNGDWLLDFSDDDQVDVENGLDISDEDEDEDDGNDDHPLLAG